PLRKAIDLVVHDDVREVDVAPRRVQEVGQADAEAVAVAAGRKDGEVGVGDLDAGGQRQDAAVDAMDPERSEVRRDVAGAADAGGQDGAVGVEGEVGGGLLQGGEHAEVAAAGAPDGVF